MQVLLKMTLDVMTLKTLFSSHPTMSFCLDARYCASAFLLINISNLFITK